MRPVGPFRDEAFVAGSLVSAFRRLAPRSCARIPLTTDDDQRAPPLSVGTCGCSTLQEPTAIFGTCPHGESYGIIRRTKCRTSPPSRSQVFPFGHARGQ